MIKKILIVLLLFSGCAFAYSQETPTIETVFGVVGKQKGSVMIELAKDVLGGHTRITRYRSLIATADSITLSVILQVLENETEGGSTLMESKKNGRLETGSYLLKNSGNEANEYLLYSLKSNKITFIYLRGAIPPDELESELDKLKNLFIKVNNKTIKL